MPSGLTTSQKKELASGDLRGRLEKLALNLFGQVQMRWVDAYFPFTDPSAELEILYRVSYSSGQLAIDILGSVKISGCAWNLVISKWNDRFFK